MVSSKNPSRAILVPQEIINLAAVRPEIVCNLRPSQRPEEQTETEEEKETRKMYEGFFDCWFFYKPVEGFLKDVRPGTRLILVCQNFGEDIFTLITDIKDIYWADKHYPRIDFNKKPRIVRQLFGESNLWGGFILAVARVGKVKKQAQSGYNLLFKIAKRPGGLRRH